MKKHHFIFLYFVTITVLSLGQNHLNYTYTNIVFVDSTNVRETPSTTGRVIGKVSHNSPVTECQSSDPVEGKVGSVTDYWQPIFFEGTSGYIWRPNLADGFFKSELDPDVHFLINFVPNKGLEFKVFRQNNFVSNQFFEYKNFKDINGSVSLGTTFNSKGNEVIAVALDSGYKLFEWDGTVLKSSELKLQDASGITGNYFPWTQGFINTNKVNVRSAPKLKASVLETLDSLTKVKLSEENRLNDTVNGNPGFWYGIKRNGKTGYVWSDFIDVPERYVKSNKVESESFLYTTHAIYVLDGSTVKYRFPIENLFYHDGDNSDEMYKNDFIQFGNRGLDPNYQFLGICYSAFSCGEAGGDKLYLWDGNKMIYFADDYGIGDGGYSENHNYVFPNQVGGVKGKVILEESDEYYGINSPDCESTSCVFNHSRYELEFDGDTLAEVESPDSRLRAFLLDSLTEFELKYNIFSDLNKDGVEDAVFLMTEISDTSGEITDDFSAPLIGVVFGNVSGSFGTLKTNQSLAMKDFFCIDLKTKNDTLEIRVNYNLDDGYSDAEVPSYSQFSFVYDSTYNKLIWYSKIEAEDQDLEDNELIWTITNKERFKKNKVAFENAWEKDRGE